MLISHRGKKEEWNRVKERRDKLKENTMQMSIRVKSEEEVRKKEKRKER